MRPRQAILLTIGALGAGFVGASIHGVATVNADLEQMSSTRQKLERTVKDDCPFEERKRPSRNTEI